MKIFALVVLGVIVAALAATVRFVPAGREPVGGAEPSTTGFVIPVRGVQADELRDSWNEARDGGARSHQGLDIAAARGTPVLATLAGRIEKLHQSDAGGVTVYIRSVDTMAYYAHLAGYAQGIAEGQDVRAGQVIGFVGDSGNAGAGNFHLHFALARMGPDDRWWEGTPVNPYPLLAAKGAGR